MEVILNATELRNWFIRKVKIITNFNPSPFAIFSFYGVHAAQSAWPFDKPNGSVVSDSLSIYGYQNIRA